MASAAAGLLVDTPRQAVAKATLAWQASSPPRIIRDILPFQKPLLCNRAVAFCLLWEMTDIYMLNGVLYTMQPEDQIRVLLEAVDELTIDAIE